METIKIDLNEAFTAVITIPGTSGTETYPYTIKRAYDGSIFASGNMVFIVDSMWKIAFTPVSEDTYLLRVPHLTIADKDYGNNYLAKSAETTEVLVTATPTTENEELLAAYKAARLAILAGGQTYKIETGGTKREVTRASLPQINSEIKRLESWLGLRGQACQLIQGF